MKWFPKILENSFTDTKNINNIKIHHTKLCSNSNKYIYVGTVKPLLTDTLLKCTPLSEG